VNSSRHLDHLLGEGGEVIEQEGRYRQTENTELFAGIGECE